VNTEAESEMAVGGTVNVESIRIRELRGIQIGGGE
jgi:hypothetical protein